MNTFLNPQQIQSFITDGYIRVNNAFDTDFATQVREILWKDIPADQNDRNTWVQPVVRLGMYTQEPFIRAANTGILHQSFNQLLGPGNWIPCTSMGSFPIRFPSVINSGDTGWHVDASFAGSDPNDFFAYRVNVYSKGRGLLMLFLFSDVSEDDAPTKIKKGSHIDVARLLAPEGEAGLSFVDLAEKLSELQAHEEVLATGKAGTVYLCHPFLVHAAQQHKGTVPKFMAQPPLFIKQQFALEKEQANYPVETAIINALS